MEDWSFEFYSNSYLDYLQSTKPKSGADGSEPAYWRFTSDGCDEWAEHTELEPLSDEEVERAYARAMGLLRKRGPELSAEHDLKLNELTSGAIEVSTESVQMSLPDTVSAFLEAPWVEEAPEKLSALGVNPRCEAEWGDVDFFIDGPAPIVDLLYTLQCITPGLLLITRDDNMRGRYEYTMARALPPASWVQAHQELLEDVFAGEGRFTALEAATTDAGRACGPTYASGVYVQNQYDSQEDDSSEYEEDYRWYGDTSDDSNSDDDYYTTSYGMRERKDLTACDSQCGYCGTCEY